MIIRIILTIMIIVIIMIIRMIGIIMIIRNYLCAPMSVYFNAYRDNAYNRGGEEILKVTMMIMITMMMMVVVVVMTIIIIMLVTNERDNDRVYVSETMKQWTYCQARTQQKHNSLGVTLCAGNNGNDEGYNDDGNYKHDGIDGIDLKSTS